MPQQESEQRCLAGAVGPDHADLVAPENRGGEIAHDELLAVAIGDVLGVRHDIAGREFLAQLHPHLAWRSSALLPLAAHPLQLPHAALVPSAPRLDALSDPLFGLSEFLVEEGFLLLFRRQHGLFALQESVVVARPVKQPAPIQLQDAVGQPAQEAAVMRHEDEGPVPAVQELLQPRDGVDVEVVGWLVEQQQIGRRHEGSSQQHSPLRPGRRRLEHRVAAELHPCEDMRHLLLPAQGESVSLSPRIKPPATMSFTGPRRSRGASWGSSDARAPGARTTSPSSGATWPQRIRSKVVLPSPLRPKSPIRSRRSI